MWQSRRSFERKKNGLVSYGKGARCPTPSPCAPHLLFWPTAFFVWPKSSAGSSEHHQRYSLPQRKGIERSSASPALIGWLLWHHLGALGLGWRLKPLPDPSIPCCVGLRSWYQDSEGPLFAAGGSVTNTIYSTFCRKSQLAKGWFIGVVRRHVSQLLPHSLIVLFLIPVCIVCFLTPHTFPHFTWWRFSSAWVGKVGVERRRETTNSTCCSSSSPSVCLEGMDRVELLGRGEADMGHFLSLSQLNCPFSPATSTSLSVCLVHWVCRTLTTCQGFGW